MWEYKLEQLVGDFCKSTKLELVGVRLQVRKFMWDQNLVSSAKLVRVGIRVHVTWCGS